MAPRFSSMQEARSDIQLQASERDPDMGMTALWIKDRAETLKDGVNARYQDVPDMRLAASSSGWACYGPRLRRDAFERVTEAGRLFHWEEVVC